MKFVTIRLPRRSEAKAGAIRVNRHPIQKSPELWFPVPLDAV